MNLHDSKKKNKIYKLILWSSNLQNCTLHKLSFTQKPLTPADRWQKCATKTLGTHDWICEVALSSEVIMTIVLGREKMMQLI